MIVDSSALIAILKREPEQKKFATILEIRNDLRMSAATYFETAIVIDGCERWPSAGCSTT